VELYFTVNVDGKSSEYHIIRQLAPSKCKLYKDDEDITRDSIANTTEYVCKLLNTTPDVFQNCVIMTINNATPFMAKKKLEKRKFIEGIFNLQVFSDMLISVRQDFNKVTRELDIECAKYEEISNNLAAYTEQQQNAANIKLRSMNKFKARLETNKKELESLELEKEKVDKIDIEKYQSNIAKLNDVIPTIDQGIQEIITKKSEYQTLIDVNKSKHNKIGTDKDTCPVCLSTLDDNHKHFIHEEKDKLIDLISKLKKKATTLESKLTEKQTLRSELRAKKTQQKDKLSDAKLQIQNLANIRQRIEQLSSLNDDIVDDIESLDKQDEGFDQIMKESEARLEKTQVGINKIKADLAKLDIIKFIVSEEGVKSYIVKKILQLFNSKLAHYLKKMDSNCICIFNEYFEEEIVDEKGKLCSYFNFSGAERKNIDLACLFAFMDIRRVQGDVAFNFSMYDELFDSSLDERGVELVIDILKERIEHHNECVMVISHRKESTKLATGEIIFLEKQNGVTTRVATPETDLK
jgi:DNA repair exonuclease SbcCD ATPase subunit